MLNMKGMKVFNSYIDEINLWNIYYVIVFELSGVEIFRVEIVIGGRKSSGWKTSRW